MTDLAGAYIAVPLAQRTVQVEVVDCASVLTLVSGDLLQLQTVVGLENQRVVETSSEEFTFVLYSGDGFKIQIPASTTTYQEVCGSLVYFIELSDPTLLDDYISFDGTNLLTVNTNKDSEVDLTVTVKLKNTYFDTVLITTTFWWKTCEDKTPSPNAYTGITPELMFDYLTLGATQTVDMIGN